MNNPPKPKWVAWITYVFSGFFLFGSVSCIYVAFTEVDTWNETTTLLVLAFAAAVMSFISFRIAK